MSTVNPESVQAIARKDFQDAVRSWMFWGLSLFFFVLLAGITLAIWFFAEDPILGSEVTTAVLVGVVSNVTRLIIPIIALILGWKAIAGEWESGSLKVLLSLPHSRVDVVLGKLVGRSLVLSLSLVIGFALAAIVVVATMGSFSITDYGGLLLMSIIYGIAYVSIAVTISSLTRSTTIAGAGVFGVFVLFYVVWNALFQAIQMLVFFDYVSGVEVNGFVRPPAWAYFLDAIDPGNAYANVLSLVAAAADIEAATQVQEELFGGSIPFFLQDWFAFVILAFWIVGPLAVALYRFPRVDL